MNMVLTQKTENLRNSNNKERKIKLRNLRKRYLTKKKLL